MRQTARLSAHASPELLDADTPGRGGLARQTQKWRNAWIKSCL
jgi:hypothetical protein